MPAIFINYTSPTHQDCFIDIREEDQLPNTILNIIAVFLAAATLVIACLHLRYKLRKFRFIRDEPRPELLGSIGLSAAERDITNARKELRHEKGACDRKTSHGDLTKNRERDGSLAREDTMQTLCEE
ncbi:hypothetical protein CC78DRAFT_593420 [Lojkania enalia]|uniref:Uncharacterized protein n=1 Tax=Lojkania enalia TaxID=147567 RepID=A0A9P4N5Q0_9PLEO|nr:hypothetical protein CC78DRAFT_593420 [Didymosphaeria enalia]